MLNKKILIKEYISKNLNFILFIIALALISITSSHIIDNKIKEINNIHIEIQKIKSEYYSIHSQLIKMQSEAIIKKFMIPIGFNFSIHPHYQLILSPNRNN